MNLKKAYLLYFNFIIILLVTLLNQRQESVVMQISVLVLIVIGLFVNLKTLTLKLSNNSVFNISFFLLFIIFFSTVSNQPIENWVFYLSYSLFPVVLFQVNIIFFSQNKELKIKYFKFLIILIIIPTSFQIYYVSKVLAELRGYEFQSNWANVVGSCLPVVFLIKKRKIQFFCLILMSGLLFIGLKRTGLVALGIAMVTFIFFSKKNDEIEFNLKKAVTLVTLLILIFFAFYKKGSFSKVDRAIERFEVISEDGGSGRDNIFKTGISNWWKNSKTSLPFKIIGKSRGGFENDSILGFKLYSAHNDLIDFAYDYGVFAFALMLLYYFRLVKLIFREWRNRNPYFQFILSTCLIFFVYSNLSGFYHYFFFFSPLVVCLALLENVRSNTYKSINTNNL